MPQWEAYGRSIASPIGGHRDRGVPGTLAGALHPVRPLRPISTSRRRSPKPMNPGALTADIPCTTSRAGARSVRPPDTSSHPVYVSDVVRNQRSHAVSAGVGANEALARMLEGTGLGFEHLTPRSIRILAAVVGPPRDLPRRKPPPETSCRR